VTDNTPPSGLVLSSKVYDRARFLVQVFIPALGVLYATIAATFGIGGIEQVLAVLAAIGLFIGTIMRISSNNFVTAPPAGTPVGKFVIIEQPDGKKTVRLGDLTRDPADFVNDDVISFHVDKQIEPAEEVRDENSP
jgi:hypothetical protein